LTFHQNDHWTALLGKQSDSGKKVKSPPTMKIKGSLKTLTGPRKQNPKKPLRCQSMILNKPFVSSCLSGSILFKTKQTINLYQFFHKNFILIIKRRLSSEIIT